MKLARKLFLTSVFLLISCGPPQPQYQTKFELVPPLGKSGKYCANNCLATQQICYQSCSAQQQNCEQMNMLQEQTERFRYHVGYDYYMRERNRGYPQHYIYSYTPMNCDNSACMARCDNSFNMCYENCGGKVIPHTICVANCNMPQQ